MPFGCLLHKVEDHIRDRLLVGIELEHYNQNPNVLARGLIRTIPISPTAIHTSMVIPVIKQVHIKSLKSSIIQIPHLVYSHYRLTFDLHS